MAHVVATETDEPRATRLCVSYGSLGHAMGVWAARFWEDNASEGKAPVEWVLISRRALTSIRDAMQLLSATHGLVSACEEC